MSERMSSQVNVNGNSHAAHERIIVAQPATLYTAVDALGAVWRYRGTVTAIFLLTVIVTVIVTLVMKKSYLSESQIFVRLGRENTILDVAAGLGERAMYAPPISRDAEINSIAVMMTSKDLFGMVVDRIGAERILDREGESESVVQAERRLASAAQWMDTARTSLIAALERIGAIDVIDAREKAIINLQRNVTVSVNKQTHVVGVEYESHDPKLGQAVVGSLVDEYIKQHARLNRSSNGSDFLATQLQAAKEALTASENAFEAFKTKTKMLSVAEHRRVLVERIAQLENESLSVEAQLRSVAAEVASLESLLADIPQVEALAQTAGAGNEAIDGMRQEVFRLQVRREELLAKYLPDHPEVVKLETQLKQAQMLFEAIESQLVESVRGPSRIYEGARLQLIERTPLMDGLRSKQEKLAGQLEQVLSELADFNTQETTFLRLEREVELCDDQYKRLERSWRQAVMDQEMQEQNVSNLSIVQPATYNPKPYRPSKMINLAGGLVIGLLLGCAVATLRDIRRRLPLRESESAPSRGRPLVAEAPRQPAQSLSPAT